jgi:hypothetical protein
MQRSLVYKNTAINNAPSAFGLTMPTDASTQKTAMIFGWQQSTDLDKDLVSYTLQIAKDSAFATINYQLEEITDTQTAIGSEAGLADMSSYYWRIIATDQYGGQKYSTQTWSFTTNNTNGLPGIIKGYVRNATNGTAIAGSTITAGSSNVSTLSNGGFIMMLPTATYNITATASGYQTKTLANIAITPGMVYDASMNLEGDTIPPVNGTCGTNNGQTLSTAPTSNICSTGVPSTPTGTGPWYWTCNGTNNGTTASCTAYCGTSKVFLGADDNFTVSSSEAVLFGNTGNSAVSIAGEATGVSLDQNIGRINLAAAASTYTFKQTGNMINVYDAAGTTLIVKAPVQGDSDGTVLSFSNGTASASAKLVGGVMTLGGVAVNSSSATILAPATTPGTPPTPTTTTAKVFLGADNSFTVGNSGTTVYGNTGKGTVTISSGIAGVNLDQNIGQINFVGLSSSYKFKQTGNLINVYDAAGTLLVKAPVQGDADGTVLSFTDGTASVMLTGGVMKLGGATVSPTTAGILTLTFK